MPSVVVFDGRSKKHVKKRLCNRCGGIISPQQGRWFNHRACVPDTIQNEYLYPFLEDDVVGRATYETDDEEHNEEAA